MKKSIMDYIFVGIQLVILVLYVFTPKMGIFSPSKLITIAGAFLIIIGLLVGIMAFMQLNTNLTPFPTPKVTAILLQTGVYSIVRHPIYSGLIYVMFGYSILNGDIGKLALSLAILILFYFKSIYEETLLTKFFPEYKKYKENTGRFFPNIFSGKPNLPLN